MLVSAFDEIREFFRCLAYSNVSRAEMVAVLRAGNGQL